MNSEQDARQLTANFSEDEVACRCGKEECDALPMELHTLLRLQRLRDLYKKPIIITSGRRCRFWNKQVKGAKNSKHLRGCAVDCLISDDEERFNFVRYAMVVGFKGIGIGKGFVHLDDSRQDGVMWLY